MKVCCCQPKQIKVVLKRTNNIFYPSTLYQSECITNWDCLNLPAKLNYKDIEIKLWSRESPGIQGLITVTSKRSIMVTKKPSGYLIKQLNNFCSRVQKSIIDFWHARSLLKAGQGLWLLHKWIGEYVMLCSWLFKFLFKCQSL